MQLIWSGIKTWVSLIRADLLRHSTGLNLSKCSQEAVAISQQQCSKVDQVTHPLQVTGWPRFFSVPEDKRLCHPGPTNIRAVLNTVLNHWWQDRDTTHPRTPFPLKNVLGRLQIDVSGLINWSHFLPIFYTMFWRPIHKAHSSHPVGTAGWDCKMARRIGIYKTVHCTVSPKPRYIGMVRKKWKTLPNQKGGQQLTAANSNRSSQKKKTSVYILFRPPPYVTVIVLFLRILPGKYFSHLHFYIPYCDKQKVVSEEGRERRK